MAGPPKVRLVPLAPDALAGLAQGGPFPLDRARGWPHRDTLPLLWTAWQGGGVAWLVTAELGPQQRPAGPASPGLVVGECAVKSPLVAGAPVEIGFGLAPGVRGHGYGQRMLGELVTTVAAAGVAEISARTGAGNAASRRLLERSGFRLGPADPDATEICYVLPGRGTPGSGRLPRVQREQQSVTVHVPDVR